MEKIKKKQQKERRRRPGGTAFLALIIAIGEREKWMKIEETIDEDDSIYGYTTKGK